MFVVESKVLLSYLPPFAISLSLHLLLLLLSCSSMNELVDKFNTAYEKHSRRGGRTTFFWDVQLSKPTLHAWDWFFSSSSTPFWVHECIAIGNLGNCIALDLTRHDKMWSCFLDRVAYVFFSVCMPPSISFGWFFFFLLVELNMPWSGSLRELFPEALCFASSTDAFKKIEIGNDNFLCWM